MQRVTKHSNDLIRKKAVDILRKLDDENGLNGEELAVIGSFCLLERVENNQLKKYEDLEEQGKLMKLPCAVGDTVYAIDSISENRHIIYDFKIDALRLALNVINKQFGKNVFLTRKEAEAALKKI